MLVRASASILLALFVAGPAGWGQVATQSPAQDLTKTSIEDLMNLEVTSASKKGQKLSRTAAAIFVITQEDIRRSGATNLPDLLRMVPGVDVAQLTANTWAISARGLNGQFSNELLVLLDGRNVYTATFGGVFWDTLDLPLEDIERIEVIRGPGGAVWGANAVNGVINVLTKKAADTPGVFVEAGGGTTQQGFGTAQYGGKLGKDTAYRIYAKYLNDGAFPKGEGPPGGDAWRVLRGGFHADATLSEKDSLSVAGGLYSGSERNPSSFLRSLAVGGPEVTDLLINLSGGSIQGAWTHQYSSQSDSVLTVSYDEYERGDLLKDQRKTVALDFQYHSAWGARHDLVVGIGEQYTTDHAGGSFADSLNPNRLGLNVFSAFAQDEIAAVPERVYVTLGTKVENNHYTGFNWMPTARVAYSPNSHQLAWAAVSRALRTPARTDTAERENLSTLPGAGGAPVLISSFGNPHAQDEGLTAFEAGYRTAVGKRFSFDLATYYHRYNHQDTTEPAAPFFENSPPPTHLVMPSITQNLMGGEAHGIELSGQWKVTQRWTISPGYAFERIHMRASVRSQDTEEAPNVEGSDPHVQAHLRSHVDLPHQLSWDVSAYFVGRLEFHSVPAYTRVDTVLAWQLSKEFSLQLAGQNLVKDRHLEFVDDSSATLSTLVKRSVYAKLVWRSEARSEKH